MYWLYWMVKINVYLYYNFEILPRGEKSHIESINLLAVIKFEIMLRLMGLKKNWVHYGDLV